MQIPRHLGIRYEAPNAGGQPSPCLEGGSAELDHGLAMAERFPIVPAPQKAG